MRADCVETNDNIYNDEDRITNRLVEQHLNSGSNIFRFIPQAQQAYDLKEDEYRGRADLQVISKNWFENREDYYLVECKRIDGKAHLNREYVSEGVSRFIVGLPKYSSYNKRNIMFGYVVQAIDIPHNITKIEGLQKDILEDVHSDRFILIENQDTEYYIYSCNYQSDKISVELRHLFYNFCDVIKNC